MNPTLSRSRLLVVTLGLCLLAAACGSASKPKSSGSSGSSVSATLNGSGSTFQKTFDDAVRAAFADTSPSITVNYAGGGSGKGKTDLQTKTVDFAGTDSLPKPEDLAKYQGGALLYFPTVAAPITVSYHLSGVKSLRLSGPTLGKIFGGKIAKWNDAVIAADNPGATLPATAITVAHRADGSGTTTNFTKFLAAAAPDDWTLGSGDTVNWGSDTRAGTGNPGVAQIVGQTEGAVGYVDLADATKSKLSTASIENRAGKFVAPTIEAAAAAVANTTVADDMSYDPINASGADAYPITSPTWIMVYAKQTDKARGTAIKQLLQFIYSTGEGLAAKNGYAALPNGIVQKAALQLGKLHIPA